MFRVAGGGAEGPAEDMTADVVAAVSTLSLVRSHLEQYVAACVVSVRWAGRMLSEG